MRRPSPYWLWILALLLPLFLVKDASLLGDQAQLILNALADNQSGRISSVGLLGTRGLHYGPVPTYLYQLMLMVSHDLMTIVYIKIIVFQALLGLSLFWLKRLFSNLSIELGLTVLLSPYILLYSRELWDNSWNLVFCALCFAAYWEFHLRQQTKFLIGSALCASLAMQTHLMSLPLIITIALHFFWNLRKSPTPKWTQALGPLTVFLLSSGHYLTYLVFSERASMRTDLSAQFLEVSLLGSRFFTAIGLDYFFERGWTRSTLSPWLMTGAMAATAWIVPFSLYSIARAGFKQSLGIFAILWLAIHTLMTMALGLGHHPHYYNAVFWVFVLFFVLTPPPRWLLRLSVLSLLFCDLSIGHMLHKNQGTQSAHYGPSLEKLIQASAQPATDADSISVKAIRALQQSRN